MELFHIALECCTDATRHLIIFTFVFLVLTAGWACNPGMTWMRTAREAVTNLIYWFFMPVFSAAVGPLAMAGTCWALGDNNPRLLPVASLPIWAQVAIIIVYQDIFCYWSHRLFHSRAAWKFHAIHHSPHDVDWITMARFHPVNLLEFVVLGVSIVVLGFSPVAILIPAPFNLAHSALVHANLNWTFGPFRYVLASPVFHRWHHATEPEAIDKNYAATFPILDILFGTYYMPEGKLPTEFGTVGEPLPEQFLDQMVYPFRRTSTSRAKNESRPPAVKTETAPITWQASPTR